MAMLGKELALTFATYVANFSSFSVEDEERVRDFIDAIETDVDWTKTSSALAGAGIVRGYLLAQDYEDERVIDIALAAAARDIVLRTAHYAANSVQDNGVEMALTTQYVNEEEIYRD